MTNYENCVIFLLAKAYQKAHGYFKRRLQTYGLTPIQHLILECLWDEEGLAVREIGSRLVLDGATLSGVLDRMSDAAWVVKKTDPEDKRITRINLGRRARKLKPRLMKERKAANKAILVELSLEEKILLKRLLRDVRG